MRSPPSPARMPSAGQRRPALPRTLSASEWGQVCLPCHGRWPAQGIRMSIRALGAAQRSAISMSSILTLRAPEMKSSAD